MAGSGQLSQTGGLRALNSVLLSQGSLGAIGGCDIIATSSGSTITAGTTAVVSLPCSGGPTKAIPANSIIVTIPAAGTATGVQSWVAASTAASANSITVTSQTARAAVTSGDSIALLSWPSSYIALTTSSPTGSALGTEYTATSYARQIIAWTAPTAANPPNAVSNGTITFGPTASSPGTTITCGALMDALTGGTAANMYAFWTFASSRTPVSGDSIQIATTALSLSDQ